ncbi:MAG: bifunctional precorrin-2 dehydrogenase/sirohydrochlorin ferrochelatase, partial [Candidatus Bathyarchaeia archaeon]
PDSSRRLAAEKGISLVEVDLTPCDPSLGALLSSADLVVVATGDPLLNLPVVKQARERGILVSVVDGPSLSDFCFPAVTRKGGIQIAVYTSGKSPALARLLRKRVEQLITNEDVLQVELQQFARGVAKRRIPDSHSRRDKLYEIIGSEDVLRSLREGNLQEAKVTARKIIEET